MNLCNIIEKCAIWGHMSYDYIKDIDNMGNIDKKQEIKINVSN